MQVMTPCFGKMNKNSEDLNNDEAFLTLLSSQRELLNRMNMESAMLRSQQANTNNRDHEMRRGSVIGPVDPLSLMNTPIVEQQRGHDIIFSQRLSNYGANDSFRTPNPGFSLMHQEQNLKESNFSDPKKMKRRRSSLGLLSDAVFFDELNKLPMGRRLSMMSNLSGFTGGGEMNFAHQDFVFDNVDPELALSVPESSSVQLNPNIPPETVRKNLHAFVSSMDKTTQSQLDIHAWDKQMGLKRSHSKTMRLTMRSRKRLRAMLKKDINSLSQNTL